MASRKMGSRRGSVVTSLLFVLVPTLPRWNGKSHDSLSRNFSAKGQRRKCHSLLPTRSHPGIFNGKVEGMSQLMEGFLCHENHHIEQLDILQAFISSQRA